MTKDTVETINNDPADVEDTENTLSPPTVTKYQTAGTIVSKALTATIALVIPGATVHSVCQGGNESLTALSKTVFNKGSVAKGIAFPTCVSVNEHLCHLCPLPSDPEALIVLKKGISF
jgi:methionine aminopeptidase